MEYNRICKRQIIMLFSLMRISSFNNVQSYKEISAKIDSVRKLLADATIPMNPFEVIDRRRLLSENQSLSDIFGTMWIAACPSNSIMTMEEYIAFSMTLRAVLIGNHSIADGERQAREDWDMDNKTFGQLSKVAFFDLLFELIETWTDIVDARYHSAFAWSMLAGAVDMSTMPFRLRRANDLSMSCMMKIDDEKAMLNEYENNRDFKTKLTIERRQLSKIHDVQRQLIRQQRVSNAGAGAVSLAGDDNTLAGSLVTESIRDTIDSDNDSWRSRLQSNLSVSAHSLKSVSTLGTRPGLNTKDNKSRPLPIYSDFHDSDDEDGISVCSDGTGVSFEGSDCTSGIVDMYQKNLHRATNNNNNHISNSGLQNEFAEFASGDKHLRQYVQGSSSASVLSTGDSRGRSGRSRDRLLSPPHKTLVVIESDSKDRKKLKNSTTRVSDLLTEGLGLVCASVHLSTSRPSSPKKIFASKSPPSSNKLRKVSKKDLLAQNSTIAPPEATVAVAVAAGDGITVTVGGGDIGDEDQDAPPTSGTPVMFTAREDTAALSHMPREGDLNLDELLYRAHDIVTKPPTHDLVISFEYNKSKSVRQSFSDEKFENSLTEMVTTDSIADSGPQSGRINHGNSVRGRDSLEFSQSSAGELLSNSICRSTTYSSLYLFPLGPVPEPVQRDRGKPFPSATFLESGLGLQNTSNFLSHTMPASFNQNQHTQSHKNKSQSQANSRAASPSPFPHDVFGSVVTNAIKYRKKPISGAWNHFRAVKQVKQSLRHKYVDLILELEEKEEAGKISDRRQQSKILHSIFNTRDRTGCISRGDDKYDEWLETASASQLATENMVTDELFADPVNSSTLPPQHHHEDRIHQTTVKLPSLTKITAIGIDNTSPQHTREDLQFSGGMVTAVMSAAMNKSSAAGHKKTLGRFVSDAQSQSQGDLNNSNRRHGSNLNGNSSSINDLANQSSTVTTTYEEVQHGRTLLFDKSMEEIACLVASRPHTPSAALMVAQLNALAIPSVEIIGRNPLSTTNLLEQMQQGSAQKPVSCRMAKVAVPCNLATKFVVESADKQLQDQEAQGGRGRIGGYDHNSSDIHYIDSSNSNPAEMQRVPSRGLKGSTRVFHTNTRDKLYHKYGDMDDELNSLESTQVSVKSGHATSWKFLLPRHIEDVSNHTLPNLNMMHSNNSVSGLSCASRCQVIGLTNSGPWVPKSAAKDVCHDRSSHILGRRDRLMLQQHQQHDPSEARMSIKKQEAVKRVFESYVRNMSTAVQVVQNSQEGSNPRMTPAPLYDQQATHNINSHRPDSTQSAAAATRFMRIGGGGMNNIRIPS